MELRRNLHLGKGLIFRQGLGLGLGLELGLGSGVGGKSGSVPVPWSWGKAWVGAGPGSWGLISKFAQVVKTRYLNPPK